MQKTSDARAIAQGDAFLYIRTLGGPTGASGPLYGPYPVSAGTDFETDDIPAGAFTGGFLVIHATRDLGNFTSALLKPDAEFPESTKIPAFFPELAGIASIGRTSAITVKEGEKNSVSVTLVPVIDNASTISLLERQTVSLAADPFNPVVRKFLLLENVALSSTGALSSNVAPSIKPTKFVCTVSGAGTVGQIAVYDETGALVTGGKYDAQKKQYGIPFTSDMDLYLYVEYSNGAVGLKFDVLYGDYQNTDANVAISIKNAGGEQGKRVFAFLILDDGDKYPVNGVASFTIQPDGTGSRSLVSYETGNPVTVPPGAYFLGAYIDMSGSPGSAYENKNGDYEYLTNVSVTGSDASFVIDRKDFSLVEPSTPMYTYYVANSHKGDGLTSDGPCTIDEAIALIAANTSPTNTLNTVYLTENIVCASATGYTIPTDKGISFSQSIGDFSITLGTNISGSLITVPAGATLYLEGVDLSGDPAKGYYADNGLVCVESGGVFALWSGSYIMNNVSTTSGAGVNFQGGSGTIDGGHIEHCDTTTTGGGVYVGYGTSFVFRNGVIEYCTAQGDGGAVYSDGMFEMGNGLINYCTSQASGGGVYINKGTFTFGIGGSVSFNQAKDYGGGLYIGAGLETFTSTKDVENPVITENKLIGSTDTGSGVYLQSNGGPCADAYSLLNDSSIVYGNLFQGSLSESQVYQP